ncbi:MAG: carbohydrate ABC transporter permease [Caldilineaceae bacterium]|nr:carbohydrate ABC transporter permease [Caldilineaceae bacterium]
MPWGNLLTILIMTPLLFAFLYPFLWMFAVSVSPSSINPYAYPPNLLPWIGGWVPTVEHFSSLMDQFPFFRFLINSFIYVIGEIIPMLFVSSLAGYVLGRWLFPGRDLIFTLILATFIVPAEVTLIPTYLVVKTSLGLNNYQSLIVPVWTSAFTIFLMRQAFQGLPSELESAAIVDGAGEFRIFWQIMLPLTRPTLAFAATTAFAATWGDYLRPLIYLTSEEFYPITLGILMLNSAFYGSFNVIAAGMVLGTLPIAIVFFLAQKHLCAACQKGR